MRRENQNARTVPYTRGMEVLIRGFLTSALEVSGRPHVPADLPPRKKPPVRTEEEPGWIPQPVSAFGRMKTSCPAGNGTTISRSYNS